MTRNSASSPSPTRAGFQPFRKGGPFRRRRALIIGTISAILVASLGWYGMKKFKRGGTSDAKTYTVERRNISHELQLTGKIVPASSMVIAAPQAGRIVEILVQEGAQVKTGDLLFTLRLEARGQQDLLAQRADVSRLELEVASLAAAVNDRRAVRELLATAQLIKDESDLNQARVSLRAARDRLEVLESDMGAAGSTHTRAAGKAVSDKNAKSPPRDPSLMYVRSPKDGIVTLIDKDPGDFVWGGGGSDVASDRTVMVVADMSQLIVRTRVLEADLRFVQRGLPVRVKLDAWPDAAYDGTVSHIGGQGRTDRTAGYTYFDVDVTVDSQDSRVLPEMNATVVVVFASRENVLALPLAAVALLPDRAFVLKADDSQSEKKPAPAAPEKAAGAAPETDATAVAKNTTDRAPGETDIKVGVVSESDVEILEGLAEGDKVREIDFAKIRMDQGGGGAIGSGRRRNASGATRKL